MYRMDGHRVYILQNHTWRTTAVGEKMSSEDVIKRRWRKVSLRGTYTDLAADFLIQNKLYTEDEKREIIVIARRIALNSGHDKIYADTIKLAIREWRKSKPQLTREEMIKKVEEELKGYVFNE